MFQISFFCHDLILSFSLQKYVTFLLVGLNNSLFTVILTYCDIYIHTYIHVHTVFLGFGGKR